MVDAVTAGRFKLPVTPEVDLSKPTVAEKDALILTPLPLVGQLAAALVRITDLETREAISAGGAVLSGEPDAAL